MSVFTALPQDMLQWEINRFLDPLSSLHWNEVLKSDERVYKKFPKYYAIKHQIKLAHSSYETIARGLEINLQGVLHGFHGRIDNDLAKIHLENSLVLLKKYFAWFKDPKNHIVLMYTEGRKENFLESIRWWTEDDMELYDFISEGQIEEIRGDAIEVARIIEKIPFVRHVPAKMHKSIFGT